MPTKKKTSVKKTSKKTTRKKVSKKTISKIVKKTLKKVTKKRTTEKTVSKANKNISGKKVLVCADAEHCFWSSDGQILASLVDLETSLSQMEDDVFKYHVTKDKNDFADWVGDILRDNELADAIRKSKKPATARTIVVRRLKIYNI